jgi:ribonuclease P protein component
MKTKIIALKNNEDFKNLLKGHKLSNKYFVMFYKKLLKKNSNKLNISIVTNKKLGNAVMRNFCKRRFKNIVNEAVKKISLNFDYSYLILAKDNALRKDSFDDIKKTMFAEFNKIR